MIPGLGPGPSGQAVKLGMLPYLVVTMTSFSIMGMPSFRAEGSLRQVSRDPARFVDHPRCRPIVRAAQAFLFPMETSEHDFNAAPNRSQQRQGEAGTRRGG